MKEDNFHLEHGYVVTCHKTEDENTCIAIFPDRIIDEPNRVGYKNVYTITNSGVEVTRLVCDSVKSNYTIKCPKYCRRTVILTHLFSDCKKHNIPISLVFLQDKSIQNMVKCKMTEEEISLEDKSNEVLYSTITNKNKKQILKVVEDNELLEFYEIMERIMS